MATVLFTNFMFAVDLSFLLLKIIQAAQSNNQWNLDE